MIRQPQRQGHQGEGRVRGPHRGADFHAEDVAGRAPSRGLRRSERRLTAWWNTPIPCLAMPRRRILPLLLIAVGVLAYVTSLQAGFVFDDYARIVRNSRIRSLDDLPGLVTNTSRPLLKLSFAINYAFGGLEPVGYHAANLAIHLIAGLALYGVVRRTIAIRYHEQVGAAGPWLAGATALLWLVHPLQTQAVTYVVQRGESLAGMLYLGTLYCAIRHVQASGRTTARRIWLGAAVVASSLGMGAKEVMVTVPVAVWIYDFVFLARALPGRMRTRWPLHLGVAASWVVLFGFIGPSNLFAGEFARPELETAGRLEYALSQPEILLHYLRLALWPHPLCFDYLWPVAGDWRQIVPSLVAILALLAATLWGLIQRSWLGFAGAWFFLVLAPTSSVHPIVDLAVEHRMYLALAAPILVIVVGAHAILEPAGIRGRRCAAALVVMATLVLGSLTAMRNLDYRSPLHLWQATVEVRPGSPRAHYNLANELQQAMRLEEAIEEFRAALELEPRSDVHNNLGLALLDAGRPAESMPHYREALALDPGNDAAHFNMALAHRALGQLDEAIAGFQRYRASLAPALERRSRRAAELDARAKRELARTQAEQAAKGDPGGGP